MEMITNNALEPPVSQSSKKRQLNYLKCRFCRQSKKKCEPVHRKWPGQRCDRCKEEGLDCSENLRATGRTRRRVEASRLPPAKAPDTLPTKPAVVREGELVKRIRKLEAIVVQLSDEIETEPVRHTSSAVSPREGVSGHDDQGHKSPSSGDMPQGSGEWKGYYDLSLRVAYLQRVKRYMQSLSSLGLDETGNYCHLPLLPEDAEDKYDMVTAFADDVTNKLKQEKSICETTAFRLSLARSLQHHFDDSLTRSLTKLVLDINTNYEAGGVVSELTVPSEILSSLSDRNLDEADLAMALGIQEIIVLKMLDGGVALENHDIVRSAVSRYCQIHTLCQDRLTELCEYPWHKMAVIPPLHMLLSLSRQQSLLHLITEPDMARTDFFGRSLFHLALDLKLDGLDRVKILFKSFELQDMTKRKPLHISTLNGQMATSFALADSAARVTHLQDQDREGRTALHIASAKGHATIFLRLLKLGAAIDSRDIKGRTPLYYAVVMGQVSTTSIHAKITPWQDWSTLVLPAVEGGNVAVVNTIMDKLTSPLSAEVKTKALEKAVLKGNENLVEFLLQVTDLDVYIDRQCYGRRHETLLEFAVRTGNANIVELLISKYDASVDFADLLGWSYHFIAPGFEDMVSVLLGSGKADLNSRSKLGETALHFAALVDCDQIVRILLTHGADIEICDSKGRTPLFNAVTQKNVGIVEMLLVAGARVDVKDTEDKSPLDLCMENDAPSMEISHLLVKYTSRNSANR